MSRHLLIALWLNASVLSSAAAQTAQCLATPPPPITPPRPIQGAQHSFTWLSDAGSQFDVWCFTHKVTNLHKTNSLYVQWSAVGLDDSIAPGGSWELPFSLRATGAISQEAGLRFGFVPPMQPIPTSIYKPRQPITSKRDGTLQATAKPTVETTLKDGRSIDVALWTVSEAFQDSKEGWSYRVQVQNLSESSFHLEWITQKESPTFARTAPRLASGLASHDPRILIDSARGLNHSFQSGGRPLLVFAPLVVVKPDGSQGTIGLVPAYVPTE